MGGLCGSSREQPRAEDVGEGGAGSPQISVLVRLCYINVLRKNWSLNILFRKQIGRSAQFFAVAGWGGDEWVSHPGAGCGVLLRQTCQDGIQVVCRPQ